MQQQIQSLQQRVEGMQHYTDQLSRSNEALQERIELLETRQAFRPANRLVDYQPTANPPPESEPDGEQSDGQDDEQTDGADDELSDLLSDSSLTEDDRFSIYGYADVVLGYNRYGSGTTGFDMYHWQTFFEYRVTDYITFIGDLTFEHGPTHTGGNLGDIKTRAYATIDLERWFKINVGKFLTPYGEYNLYHDATPVYTSVNSPRSIYWRRGIGVNTDATTRRDRFFAKEGTGVWVWGNIDFVEDLCLCKLEDWSLEYNLYAINGRGTGNTAQVDSNEDKGLGCKVEVHTPYDLSFGYSHYGDKDTRLLDSRTIHDSNALQVIYHRKKLTAYYEHAWADYGADGNATGFYAQLDYTICDPLTLYYRYDDYKDLTIGRLEGDERIHTMGINWTITPGVYFKVEHGFYEGELDVFQSQFALAY